MSEEAKAKRKVWSRPETIGFLECYNARKEEFLHSRKKKFAYQHVLEDMLDKNLTDSSTTALALESKMRTLLTAYKAAKDNANRTGASPCNPPFEMEMDEIFGDRPIICNTHTLHLGRGPTTPLSAKVEPIDEETTPSPEFPQSSKKRKSTLKEYKEEKLQIKRLAAEKKAEQREQFYNNLGVMMRERMEKINDRENKKLELLEKILNKNNS